MMSNDVFINEDQLQEEAVEAPEKEEALETMPAETLEGDAADVEEEKIDGDEEATAVGEDTPAIEEIINEQL